MAAELVVANHEQVCRRDEAEDRKDDRIVRNVELGEDVRDAVSRQRERESKVKSACFAVPQVARSTGARNQGACWECAHSSMVKVVNWMDVNSSKNSSAEVGNETPPKSVRWVQLQCKKPSGRAEGGGEATHPSVLQMPRGTSQYWHCTPVSQERPVRPVLHTQRPCTHTPFSLQ